MDALTSLWLTSIVGAAGFTATGYFFARSRMPREVSLPAAAADEPALPAPAESRSSDPSPPPEETPEAPSPVLATAAARVAAPAPTGRPRDPRREEDDEDEIVATDVLAKPTPAMAFPSTVQAVELERQLDAVRVELRAEVVARHSVEAHAKELEARLASMSQQVATLRARTAADASASKRDAAQRGSMLPGANVDPRSRLGARAPGLFAEIDELKADIARLTSENESLRASALGASVPAPRARGPRSDLIVPDVLKRMIERIARIDNVRAAAVVENNGLVLASSGERGDALAAFGNYIRDAASRSTRLLPLGVADEVIVRDVHGVVFSSRTLGRPEAELALITLASSAIAVRELREIVEQTPGLGADGISAR